MKRPWLFIVVLGIALLLLAQNHLGRSAGDWLFEVMGLSPWTGTSGGPGMRVHFPVLIGLILLIAGATGTVRAYRRKYPGVLRYTTVGCFAFILLYPLLTAQIMVALKQNVRGVGAIAYVKENSQCQVRQEQGEARTVCQFVFYNYGPQQEIVVKPVLTGPFSNVQFRDRGFSLPAHKKITVGADYSSIPSDASGFTGTLKAVGAEIEANGEKKTY